MDLDERERLLYIRLASKRGDRLSPRDQSFCQAMYTKDPRGYKEMNDVIHKIILKEMSQ